MSDKPKRVRWNKFDVPGTIAALESAHVVVLSVYDRIQEGDRYSPYFSGGATLATGAVLNEAMVKGEIAAIHRANNARLYGITGAAEYAPVEERAMETTPRYVQEEATA